jgi:hypothetical protein
LSLRKRRECNANRYSDAGTYQFGITLHRFASCRSFMVGADMISEERESNAANEHCAISVLASRSVRVGFKIVVVDTGIGLQVRVEAFSEKIVILIQQIREAMDHRLLKLGSE